MQIKKALLLEVRLWVEGEDEAAHDFAAGAAQAVQEVIAAGAVKHPELTITVRSVKERH